MRVPVLVLDDEDVLVDCNLMLDHLDRQAPGEKSLWPAEEPDRHRALKVSGLATGLADKAVSLFYEYRLHERHFSPIWVERCKSQIAGALSVLEEDRAERQTTYWFGEDFGHADIAVSCAIRHVTESLPISWRCRTIPRSWRIARAGGDAGVQGDQPALHPAGIGRALSSGCRERAGR